MITDKNTTRVVSENVEIKRIMSEGGYCGKRFIGGRNIT